MEVVIKKYIMEQFRLKILVESRIRWKVYVRFGGEYLETYHSNMTRRWVLSLRYDVAVVDCDYPQHSIAGMRKRDAEQVGADEDYKRMAYEQFTRLGKKAYPVLCSSPEKAIATADEYVAAGHVPDIVFFDLSGTVNGSTL